MATADPSVARRQRRRDERRDRVYSAAVALFIERGYDGTTMDDIADRADVARTTVFNYFARKSAFLDEWAARRRARAFGAVSASDRPFRERFIAVLTAFADVSLDTREETVALFGSAVRELNLLDHPALADELRELIELADPSEVIPGVDAELVAITVATGYFAVMNAWSKPGPIPFDLSERLRRMATLVTDGFTRAPRASAPSVRKAR